MLFAVTAIDRKGALALRMETRPAHLQYWQDNAVSLVLGGPFLDGEGKPTGSMVVVEAETLEAAQALLAADPYTLAGLFESVDIRAWNWVLKRPGSL